MFAVLEEFLQESERSQWHLLKAFWIELYSEHTHTPVQLVVISLFFLYLTPRHCHPSELALWSSVSELLIHFALTYCTSSFFDRQNLLRAPDWQFGVSLMFQNNTESWILAFPVNNLIYLLPYFLCFLPVVLLISSLQKVPRKGKGERKLFFILTDASGSYLCSLSNIA